MHASEGQKPSFYAIKIYEKVTDLYLFQSHLAANNEQRVELYSQFIFKVSQPVTHDYFSHPIF